MVSYCKFYGRVAESPCNDLPGLTIRLSVPKLLLACNIMDVSLCLRRMVYHTGIADTSNILSLFAIKGKGNQLQQESYTSWASLVDYCRFKDKGKDKKRLTRPHSPGSQYGGQLTVLQNLPVRGIGWGQMLFGTMTVFPRVTSWIQFT